MFVLMLLKMKQSDFEGQSHEWTVTLLAEFAAGFATSRIQKAVLRKST